MHHIPVVRAPRILVDTRYAAPVPLPKALVRPGADTRRASRHSADSAGSNTTSPPPSTPPDAFRLTTALRRLSEARAFQLTAIAVIVFNAVLIGVETYDSLVEQYGRLFFALDAACLTFFIVELAIRIGAFGRRPWQFFKGGWNVFDFIVVAAVLVPGLRENVTLLRMLRLARIVRILRAFPSLRILLTAVWRSLPSATGVFGIAAVVLYLYGMVGWILFGEAQPEEYGTIGDSVLTLFALMTMDNVSEVLRGGMEVTGWAVPYYVSYVMFGGFVLINLLIGVVITSMEEARNMERAEKAASEGTDMPDPTAQAPQPAPAASETADTAEILARLEELQRAVAAWRPDASEPRRGPDSPPEN